MVEISDRSGAAASDADAHAAKSKLSNQANERTESARVQSCISGKSAEQNYSLPKLEFTDTKKEPEKPVTETQKAILEKDVRELHQQLTGYGAADKQIVFSLLEKKTPEELKTMQEMYQNLYPDSTLRADIEKRNGVLSNWSYGEVDRALNALDNNLQSADGRRAAFLHEKFTALRGVYGPANGIVENEIRESLLGMTPAQIKSMKEAYAKQNGGDAFEQDMNRLSSSGRDAVNIILGDGDKVGGNALRPSDRFKLAEIALKNSDDSLMNQALGGKSDKSDNAKEAREAFRKHHTVDEMKTDYQKEIYKNGKLSVAEQIKENTGYVRNTTDGIENALKNMSLEERRMYQLGAADAKGKKLDGTEPSPAELAEARRFYTEVHDALGAADKLSPNDNISHWEQVIAGQQRPVIQAMDDHKHVMGNDRKAMLEAIKGMTDEEKKKYREDRGPGSFREELDNKVRQYMSGTLGGRTPELLAAQRALDNIDQGRDSNNDLVLKVCEHSNDPQLAASDLREAFKQNPELREQVGADVEKYLRTKMSDEDMKNIFEPLLQGKEVSMEQQFGSKATGDQSSVYTAMKHATPQERELLLMQPVHGKELAEKGERGGYRTVDTPFAPGSKEAQAEALQQKVFAGMNEKQIEVARNILKQGGTIRAEDEVRGLILDKSCNREQLRSCIEKMTPDLRAAYATKYGDLTGDVLSSIPDSDKAKNGIRQALEGGPRGADEVVREALREQETARRGVNITGDGTGAQLDQATHNMVKSEQLLAVKTKAEQQKALEDFSSYLNAFVDSKSHMAKDISTVAVAVAAVATGPILKLLAGAAQSATTEAAVAAAIGGTIKPLANAAFQWGTYGGKDAASDAATGIMDALGAKLGSSEALKLVSEGAGPIAKALLCSSANAGTSFASSAVNDLIQNFDSHKTLGENLSRAMNSGKDSAVTAFLASLVASAVMSRVKSMDTAAQIESKTYGGIYQAGSVTAGKTITAASENAASATRAFVPVAEKVRDKKEERK